MDQNHYKATLKALEDAPTPTVLNERRVIPFGFASLDTNLLRVGGIVRGRISQIYGPEAQGKTLSALRLCAMAQRLYPEEAVVWIDTEHTFDFDWAERNEVDARSPLFRYHATTVAEEAMQYIANYLSKPRGVISLLVVDSIGNINTARALQGASFDVDGASEFKTKIQPGIQAKLTTELIKNITHQAAQAEVAVLMLNQVREKIGVLYGDPETTPGGKALRHNLTLDMRVRLAETVVDGDKEVEGVRIAYTIRKYKLGSVNKTTDQNHPTYYFDNGIVRSRVQNVYDNALRSGALVRAGAWFTVTATGERFQGQKAVIAELSDNTEFLERLEGYVLGISNDVQEKPLKHSGAVVGIYEDESSS